MFAVKLLGNCHIIFWALFSEQPLEGIVWLKALTNVWRSLLSKDQSKLFPFKYQPINWDSTATLLVEKINKPFVKAAKYLIGW